jgi:hypothetical protein
MTWKRPLSSRKYLLFLGVFVCLVLVGGAALLLATLVFADMPLNDFTNTFYRAANYLVRGENVYSNSYLDVRDGREYPPYSPIWVVFHALPLAFLPLHYAEAFRFLIEVALLPLMAVISAKWAGLKNNWKTVLLVGAPWFAILVLAGQISVLVFAGILLCFFGVCRSKYFMVGVGLWLVLLKPHIVSLIVLAVILYAWRNRILFKSFVVLLALTSVGFVVQPLWINDLVLLTTQRLENPGILESVLLLPGYPFAQLTLLAVGGVFLLLHLARSPERAPSKWLWSVLVTVSLIGALHTVPYDWLNLMLPLALLMRQRWGVVLTIALYLYPLVWGAFLLGLDFHLISPTIIPTVILGALLMDKYLMMRKQDRVPVAWQVGI